MICWRVLIKKDHNTKSSNEEILVIVSKKDRVLVTSKS